jgi:NDP-sugar pyrophosphorylase family protein
MSEHLSIELSKRLHELGAFEGRGWQVGDFALLDLVSTDSIVKVVVLKTTDNYYLDVCKISNLTYYRVQKSYYFLLPSLSDLLEEIERVSGKPPKLFPIYLPQNGYGHGCVLEGVEHFWCDGGCQESYLEAAASCLLKVLEAKK